MVRAMTVNREAFRRVLANDRTAYVQSSVRRATLDLPLAGRKVHGISLEIAIKISEDLGVVPKLELLDRTWARKMQNNKKCSLPLSNSDRINLLSRDLIMMAASGEVTSLAILPFVIAFCPSIDAISYLKIKTGT